MKSIGLIALDLDGTLLDSQKCLSPRNKEALCRCARLGIEIVPTTGRAVDGIMPEIRALAGVNYAITTNGASVMELACRKSLNRCTLSNDKAQEIIGIIKKYHAMYDPYIDGRGITQPSFIDNMKDFGLSEVMQAMVRATRDVVPDVIRYVVESGKAVEKFNIYVADLSDIPIIRKQLSMVEGLTISSSLYNNIEINAAGATKGNALIWLSDYLGIDRAGTMAFGDGENDVSMLRAAGIGVVMGNGVEAAKKAADEVTLTNDQDGVAEAIERLIFNLM